MTTKMMKYEIKYSKELYNLLSDIQYVVFRLKNKATSMAWDWQQFSFSYNERFGEYPKEKDILGKTLSPDIYGQIKDEFGNFVASSIVDSSIQEAVKKFKNDSPEILAGKRAIPTYRRNGSFPIRKNQIKNLTKINTKTYTCKLSLLSREGVKERGLKSGQFEVTLRTGKGAYQILDRIIEGTYKMCDSRITKTKNKFYLLLTYNFESEKKQLNKNKIMGIDLGVNIPAMLAVSDDKYYRQAVGSKEEVDSFRRQVEARKRSMQRQRKWCGEGSVGHGTKTRLKPLEKLSGKIARFKDTKNHCWSRYIINEAIKNDCGVIQMEDLTGIAENNTFLKTWTYYDLQQKIKYKAEEVGIKVVMIDPAHTSGRCHKCGHIHRSDNKELWRPTQEQFKCLSCGENMNADWNAAKNIATKDIDKIIKEQLEKQKEDKLNLVN